MNNLETFYVIWRADGDDFMITRLDLDPLMMAPGSARLTNFQVIQMAFDAEFIEEVNPYVGDNPAPYDLIEIISGDNISFHMQ